MNAAETARLYSNEELREALLALERARRHEAEQRRETEGLLEALQALGEAGDPRQVFDRLFGVLHRFVPFTAAFTLAADDAGDYESAHATAPAFEGLVWPDGPTLRRVQTGKIVPLFDLQRVPECHDWAATRLAGARSAILAPLTRIAGTRCKILVFVHPQPAFFNQHHVRLLERFAPLTNQALASIEYRRQLEARAEELRRANEALETTHLQLLQSEKMASIGQLAAGVAHEINNPVGFVLSNLCTLGDYLRDLTAVLAAYEAVEAEMPAGAPALQYVRELKRRIDLAYVLADAPTMMAESLDGCTRVRKIVQDLKDFSRAGTDEDWQSASVEQCLESTLNVCWNDLKYKVELHREFAGVPDIHCLPSQLNQVFLNLIVNAGQAIADHGHLWLRTRQDGEGVTVEVEDDGRGIAPEHLGRIFDPFFTTKPVGQGTGLGLALSYGIVRKHEGRIEVDSTPGRGTRFRVWLPSRRAAKAGDAG